MNDYYELIDALDDYREKRNAWQDAVGRPGFYDPCGYAEEHAKAETAEALRRLDEVFKRLVAKAAPACGCPHQPLQ